MVARLLAESPATVTFALDHRGAVVVSATVAGRGPFRLLVDTGSNRSALSETAAEAIGARLVARTEVGTSTEIGGWQGVAEVGPIAVGSAIQPRLLTAVLTRQELGALGTNIDGILGQDFLRTFSYTIDYRRRLLLWHAGSAESPAPNGIRLTLRPDNGRFVVELPQGQDDPRPVRFVPDSGADGLVVFERAGRLPLSIDRPDRTASVLGVAGPRESAYGSIAALRIGTGVWRNWPVAVLPGREDIPNVDGLLPLRLFSRVSFLPDEGILVVQR